MTTPDESGGHPPHAIVISNLSKRFGPVEAVKRLSLEVPEGQVFGFLGLNGAGKTTTIRILLDLLRPTGGSARIFGIDCQRESRRARALAGYLPGELGLYDDMTGAATLSLLGRLSALPVRDLEIAEPALEDVLRRFYREERT